MDSHQKEISRAHLRLQALLGYDDIPTLDISGNANGQKRKAIVPVTVVSTDFPANGLWLV